MAAPNSFFKGLAVSSRLSVHFLGLMRKRILTTLLESVFFKTSDPFDM